MTFTINVNKNGFKVLVNTNGHHFIHFQTLKYCSCMNITIIIPKYCIKNKQDKEAKYDYKTPS